MESAVVLLSGGVGSTVAAFRRRQETLLHPVYLDYKRASAEPERRAAGAVAEALGVPLQVLDLPHVAQIAAGRHPGTGVDGAEVPIPGSPDEVEGLTATMLSVGVEYAAAVGADLLVTGQSAPCYDLHTSPLSQERSVDPREVYHAFSMVLEAALPAVRPVRLETPLIDLQPFEVVKLGLRLEAPLGVTWSCHRNTTPCGACPGCKTRQAAFLTAGAPDPLLQPAGR